MLRREALVFETSFRYLITFDHWCNWNPLKPIDVTETLCLTEYQSNVNSYTDVDDVKFVINYDFPGAVEDYIHR